MRAIIQKVSKAKVTTASALIGLIDKGLVVFIGITSSDDTEEVIKIADKICKLRIFKDKNHKMSLSVRDVKGSILVVSQFTLYGDCQKGNRPSFIQAAPQQHAQKIYNELINYMYKKKINIQTGEFGADMNVELINDGPTTFIIEV